jgi:hypothetical protein
MFCHLQMNPRLGDSSVRRAMLGFAAGNDQFLLRALDVPTADERNLR